jgi:Bacteriophage KPP10, Structural protein ORF10
MRSYDPTEVTVSFNGLTIDGYGPGTFIKVSRNEDSWSLQIGNSGSGARSRNPNKSGRFEFTLLESSPANGLLSAVALADELRGEGVGEVQVKDRGTLLAKCSGQNAWIVKPPDFERAKEVGEVTWVIESDNIDVFHDGLIDA